MVTIENYEEYMMLDADGELDSVGQQALQDFLAVNPSLKSELATWQALKLQPEEAVVFPDKQSLRKAEPKAIVLNIRPYLLAAAAAVLAAIVLVPVLWKQNNTDQQIVQSGTPVKTISPVRNAARDSSNLNLIQVNAESLNSSKTPTSLSNHLIAKSSSVSKGSGVQRRVAVESIAQLDAASTMPLPQATPLPEPELQQREVSFAMVQEAPVRRASGLPRIAFAAQNQAAFDQLKDAFEARMAQVSTAARSVKETALEIKIGNGSVNLNF